MATEVKVPELPESVSEATVGEWQKKQGDAVERDENLLDLETDKVVLEVPAVAAGKLAEIKVQAGDTVQAGDVLAIIEEGGGRRLPASDDAGDGQPKDKSGSAPSQASSNEERSDAMPVNRAATMPSPARRPASSWTRTTSLRVM